MTMDVMDAARCVAEDYKGGASELARRIDKNPTTLMHELNETGTAKLGLQTAVRMSTRAKDLRILNAFAGAMSCMVMPLPESLDVDNDAVMRDLAVTAKEFADVVRTVAERCGAGVPSDNDVAVVEREWGELLAAGQMMLAHIRARHDAAEQGHVRAVDGAARANRAARVSH